MGNEYLTGQYKDIQKEQDEIDSPNHRRSLQSRSGQFIKGEWSAKGGGPGSIRKAGKVQKSLKKHFIDRAIKGQVRIRKERSA